MKKYDLNAAQREKTGKGIGRSLRREGKIPAILYGAKTEPILLSIDAHELRTILRKKETGQPLVALKGLTGETTALIKEVQVNPLTREYLHVDLLKVENDRKVRAIAPFSFVGKSVGVDMGGVLRVVRREIEVVCLPNQIPDVIEVDITKMDVGDTIHFSDLVLPEGVALPHGGNYTVAAVRAK